MKRTNERLEFARNIGRVLSKHIHDNYLTKTKVSKAIGYSIPLVCDWTQGRRLPSILALSKLSRLLGDGFMKDINNLQTETINERKDKEPDGYPR